MAAKFESYKDKSGEFRWRLVCTNGQVIADYKAKANAMGAIYSVKENASKAAIEDKERLKW